MIQLESDDPSHHEDRKIPILDVKVWVEEVADNQQLILHEFYQKEVATKAVVNARSSLPMKTKRTILTQEALRIILRCSPHLPWTTVANHLSNFNKRLQYSGYDHLFREQIARSALRAYQRILDRDKKGEQPLYRKSEWKAAAREKNKMAKKNNWFKKGGYESVVFIPATPKSELKKTYDTIIGESDVKIRVVEKSGKTLKQVLHKTNPFPKPKCNDPNQCLVCSNQEGKGNCRKENITYNIQCTECNSRYIGETARNAYSRGMEHIKALNKKDKNSVLHRHNVEAHEGTTPRYYMSVSGCHDTALTRQLTEAIQINNTPNVINNKSEWASQSTVRVQLTCD